METNVTIQTISDSIDDGGQNQLIQMETDPGKSTPGKTRLQWKISLDAISGIAGCFFFVLFTSLDNFAAASGCFLLAFICYPLFNLYLAMMKGEEKEAYNSTWLWILLKVAIFVGVTSFAVAGTFFGLAVAFEQGFQMEKDGYYAASATFALALAWSVVLATECFPLIKGGIPNGQAVTVTKPYTAGECVCECIGCCLQVLAHVH